MCGIAGVVSLTGEPIDPPVIERMVAALGHRGPDGRGTFVDGPVGLGHTRLSILDPTPAGAQPMRRGRSVLVHNGEVYNFLEIAAELRELGERIESGSDTEVILAAVRRWGPDAVTRFNGMFAFALWDGELGRLILARDRMGVKPLYFRRTSRSLVFASEPRALLAGRPVDGGDTWTPEPDLATVRDFLGSGLVDHTDRTFFDGVGALAPGHVCVVERGSPAMRRYWGPPPLADDDRRQASGGDRSRDARLVEEFGALFDSSVRLRLRSDVPIGSCLSGGLDSSSIVMTVARLVAAGTSIGSREQAPRLAFHARFPAEGIDESAFAEAVAEAAGVRLVHRTPAGTPLLAAIRPVLAAQGEPYGGASINAQYAVMAAARDEGLKVLLDGQGADELLGGYLQFLGVRVGGLLRTGHVGGALGEMRDQVARRTLSPASALLFAARGALPGGVLEAVRSSSAGRLGLRPGPGLRGVAPPDPPVDPPGTLLARRLWRAITATSLPALLRYEDRNSMAFGVEARVPFLDYRLVELGVRLPDRLRVNGGVTKAILRAAMKARIPETVRRRRDKLGFVAPQQAWLTAGRAEAADLLRAGEVVARGWVRAADVDRLLVDCATDRRAGEQLWRALIVEAWLRHWWPDPSRPGWRSWVAADPAATSGRETPGR